MAVHGEVVRTDVVVDAVADDVREQCCALRLPVRLSGAVVLVDCDVHWSHQ